MNSGEEKDLAVEREDKQPWVAPAIEEQETFEVIALACGLKAGQSKTCNSKPNLT